MRLLLDTHTFLWHSDGSPQMSAAGAALLVDPANDLFLSMHAKRNGLSIVGTDVSFDAYGLKRLW